MRFWTSASAPVSCDCLYLAHLSNFWKSSLPCDLRSLMDLRRVVDFWCVEVFCCWEDRSIDIKAPCQTGDQTYACILNMLSFLSFSWLIWIITIVRWEYFLSIINSLTLNRVFYQVMHTFRVCHNFFSDVKSVIFVFLIRFSSSVFSDCSNALINKGGINDFSFYSGSRRGPIGMCAGGNNVLIEHYLLWLMSSFPISKRCFKAPWVSEMQT